MGLLCIDELNDAREDVIGALKEIMEKQTSTVTKVKTGSFKARIAVLAACNPPNGGSYDITKNFNENLGINTALLTRFDAIFLFRDVPNPERDNNIAKMMLMSYNKEIKPDVSRELLAKYIYYMKTSGNVPTMTKDVMVYIQELYQRMRTMDLNHNAAHIGDQERRSITTRQLQSVVRFSTARARLLAKKEVDIDDVKAAEKIIMYMLGTVARDVNTGTVDISILSGKSSNDMSMEDQFFELLEQMADAWENKVDKDQFIAELQKKSKWKDEPIHKIDKAILKYENKQNISIINNNISLSHYDNNIRKNK
jgi:replicative DNA helicase Mcm